MKEVDHNLWKVMFPETPDRIFTCNRNCINLQNLQSALRPISTKLGEELHWGGLLFTFEAVEVTRAAGTVCFRKPKAHKRVTITGEVFTKYYCQK